MFHSGSQTFPKKFQQNFGLTSPQNPIQNSQFSQKKELFLDMEGFFLHHIFLIIKSDGTEFIIQFTPVEYGKEKLAILVIETAQMFWSFSVKGAFPIYKAPKAKQT